MIKYKVLFSYLIPYNIVYIVKILYLCLIVYVIGNAIHYSHLLIGFLFVLHFCYFSYSFTFCIHIIIFYSFKHPKYRSICYWECYTLFTSADRIFVCVTFLLFFVFIYLLHTYYYRLFI